MGLTAHLNSRPVAHVAHSRSALLTLIPAYFSMTLLVEINAPRHFVRRGNRPALRTIFHYWLPLYNLGDIPSRIQDHGHPISRICSTYYFRNPRNSTYRVGPTIILSAMSLRTVGKSGNTLTGCIVDHNRSLKETTGLIDPANQSKTFYRYTPRSFTPSTR